MERQPKRRRLQYENPDNELYEKRALNDLHLKSRFEAIFEKYGKDFSATGDEIDIETGEIVVNKGHLQGMTHEQDIGLDIVTTVDDHDEEDILGSSILKAAVLVTSSDVEVEKSSPRSTTTPLNYKGSRNTASSLHSSTGGRFSDSTNGQIHSSVSTETPLRRLETDRVLEGLVSRPGDMMYKSPIEPAWQAPPLPKDATASLQRSLLHSDFHDRWDRVRSLSPPSGSLWATPSGRGRTKNERIPARSRKPLARQRASSNPAFSRVKNQSQLSKDTKRPSAKKYGNESSGHKPWAIEEEKLLRHLRTNTELTFAQMMPQFPGRSCSSISSHWLRTANSRDTPTHTLKDKCTTLGLDDDRIETGNDGCGASSEHQIYEDSEVDELYLHDCVAQGSDSMARGEQIQEQSPKGSSSRTQPATVPPCISKLFPADAQDRSEEHLASVGLDAPKSLSPIIVSKTSPRTRSTTSYDSSTSLNTSSPLSRLTTAARVVTPVESLTPKKSDHERRATSSSKLSIRPLDDLSEDELATPIQFTRRPSVLNAIKVLPKPKLFNQSSPTCFNSASLRLQAPVVLIKAKSAAKFIKPKAARIDDGSEDELSTPLKTVMKKHPTELAASKRRKSSLW